MKTKLTQAQISHFHQYGYLILKQFYDIDTQISPIQKGIYDLIGLLASKYSITLHRPAFSPQQFDVGYDQLLKTNRAIVSELYDALKQIPAFQRLVSSEGNECLVSQLRQTQSVGIAGSGSGIRIDNPFENKYNNPWHQDYLGQLRSMDGVVLWSSLVPVTADMGPVKICLESHRDGVFPVYSSNPNDPSKERSYALTLVNEEQVASRYSQVSPLTNPGDVIILDFLNLHSSGSNVSSRARWSMQMRYFNFAEPSGLEISWKGSFASGVDVKSVHPEYFVKC
jgi:ectoine hydroxylase-related dioxygenase (phytanoyl-CoA dioxygenase family)